MSESGHELSELTFLALGKQGRRVRLVPLFTPPPSSFSSGHHLEHVADLQAPRRERRTTAGRAQQPCRYAHGRGEGPRRLEDRCTIEADLGPVRYLATLIGADNETVMRWFILAVALLLDPAAVLLLLAATRMRS